MDILKKILFSLEGKIGRADFIYGIAYAYLLGFTSLDALMQPISNWYLIGGTPDVAFIAQYAASVVGVILALWIFLAVMIKRFNTLQYGTYIAFLGLFIPPVILLGLQKDSDHFMYNGPMSLPDKCFFYCMLLGVLAITWFLYTIGDFPKILITSIVCLAALSVMLFSRDRDPIHTYPKQKYVGTDSFLDLIFVVALVFFVRLFIISPFQIIGPSMENTFHGGNVHKNSNGQYGDGEFILVDKLTYRLSAPKRGDVVVFSPRLGPSKKYLIKRVLGLPGDTIKIDQKFVFIATAKNPGEFVKIDESQYLGGNYGKTCIYFDCVGDETEIFQIPDGQYFLMGDNRPESLDSRHCFGNCDIYGPDIRFIPRSSISGRVAYSLGHFDMFERILAAPPVLGTMKQVIPWRGKNILNSHDYLELQ